MSLPEYSVPAMTADVSATKAVSVKISFLIVVSPLFWLIEPLDSCLGLHLMKRNSHPLRMQVPLAQKSTCHACLQGRVSPYRLLRLQFSARIGVGHHEFFVMIGWISPEQKSPGITTLQFNKQLFVLFLQSLQHVRIQNHSNLVNRILVLPHHGIKSTVQLNARRHRSFDHSPPAAVRTIFVNGIAQAFLCSLPRHFHQAER